MQIQAAYKSSVILKHVLPFDNQPITEPTNSDKNNLFLEKE